jgi:adenylosuccinate synthase
MGGNMRLIIAVSGPIAVGKSVFIGELVRQFNATRVSTRELIQSLRDVPTERGPLQEAGESLDQETDGKWVSDGLAMRMTSFSDDAVIVVDSVRIAKQVEHLRAKFGNSVRHVHLTASYDVLASRFRERKERGDPAVLEFATYEEARTNPTEAAIESLGDVADLKINTDTLQPAALVNIAAEQLHLLPES